MFQYGAGNRFSRGRTSTKSPAKTSNTSSSINIEGCLSILRNALLQAYREESPAAIFSNISFKFTQFAELDEEINVARDEISPTDFNEALQTVPGSERLSSEEAYAVMRAFSDRRSNKVDAHRFLAELLYKSQVVRQIAVQMRRRARSRCSQLGYVKELRANTQRLKNGASTDVSVDEVNDLFQSMFRFTLTAQELAEVAGELQHPSERHLRRRHMYEFIDAHVGDIARASLTTAAVPQEYPGRSGSPSILNESAITAASSHADHSMHISGTPAASGRVPPSARLARPSTHHIPYATSSDHRNAPHYEHERSALDRRDPAHTPRAPAPVPVEHTPQSPADRYVVDLMLVVDGDLTTERELLDNGYTRCPVAYATAHRGVDRLILWLLRVGVQDVGGDSTSIKQARITDIVASNSDNDTGLIADGFDLVTLPPASDALPSSDHVHWDECVQAFLYVRRNRPQEPNPIIDVVLVEGKSTPPSQAYKRLEVRLDAEDAVAGMSDGDGGKYLWYLKPSYETDTYMPRANRTRNELIRDLEAQLRHRLRTAAMSEEGGGVSFEQLFRRILEYIHGRQAAKLPEEKLYAPRRDLLQALRQHTKLAVPDDELLILARKIDANKDGNVSLEEFEAFVGFSKLELGELLRRFCDGLILAYERGLKPAQVFNAGKEGHSDSGSHNPKTHVTVEEFKHALKALQLPVTDAECSRLLRALRMNKRGYVLMSQIDELVALHREQLKRVNSAARKLRRYLFELTPKFRSNETALRETFRKIGGKDNELRAKDVVQLVRSAPLYITTRELQEADVPELMRVITGGVYRTSTAPSVGKGRVTGEEVVITWHDFCAFVREADVTADDALLKLSQVVTGSGGSVERTFKAFDCNGNGRLSRAELAHALAVVVESTDTRSSARRRRFTEAEVDVLLRRFDSNGDGELSIHEFMQFVRTGTGHELSPVHMHDHIITGMTLTANRAEEDTAHSNGFTRVAIDLSDGDSSFPVYLWVKRLPLEEGHAAHVLSGVRIEQHAGLRKSPSRYDTSRTSLSVSSGGAAAVTSTQARQELIDGGWRKLSTPLPSHTEAFIWFKRETGSSARCHVVDMTFTVHQSHYKDDHTSPGLGWVNAGMYIARSSRSVCLWYQTQLAHATTPTDVVDARGVRAPAQERDMSWEGGEQLMLHVEIVRGRDVVVPRHNRRDGPPAVQCEFLVLRESSMKRLSDVVVSPSSRMSGTDPSWLRDADRGTHVQIVCKQSAGAAAEADDVVLRVLLLTTTSQQLLGKANVRLKWFFENMGTQREVWCALRDREQVPAGDVKLILRCSRERVRPEAARTPLPTARSDIQPLTAVSPRPAHPPRLHRDVRSLKLLQQPARVHLQPIEVTSVDGVRSARSVLVQCWLAVNDGRVGEKEQSEDADYSAAGAKWRRSAQQCTLTYTPSHVQRRKQRQPMSHSGSLRTRREYVSSDSGEEEDVDPNALTLCVRLVYDDGRGVYDCGMAVMPIGALLEAHSSPHATDGALREVTAVGGEWFKLRRSGRTVGEIRVICVWEECSARRSVRAQSRNSEELEYSQSEASEGERRVTKRSGREVKRSPQTRSQRRRTPASHRNKSTNRRKRSQSRRRQQRQRLRQRSHSSDDEQWSTDERNDSVSARGEDMYDFGRLRRVVQSASRAGALPQQIESWFDNTVRQLYGPDGRTLRGGAHAGVASGLMRVKDFHRCIVDELPLRVTSVEARDIHERLQFEVSHGLSNHNRRQQREEQRRHRHSSRSRHRRRSYSDVSSDSGEGVGSDVDWSEVVDYRLFSRLISGEGQHERGAVLCAVVRRMLYRAEERNMNVRQILSSFDISGREATAARMHITSLTSALTMLGCKVRSSDVVRMCDAMGVPIDADRSINYHMFLRLLPLSDEAAAAAPTLLAPAERLLRERVRDSAGFANYLDIRRPFSLLDTRGNGTVTSDQFKQSVRMLGVSMTDSEVAALMARLDKKGDGMLDYYEFAQIVELDQEELEELKLKLTAHCSAHVLPVPSAVQRLERAFSQFDRGNSGNITAREFKHAVAMAGLPLTTTEAMLLARHFRSRTTTDGVDTVEYRRALAFALYGDDQATVQPMAHPTPRGTTNDNTALRASAHARTHSHTPHVDTAPTTAVGGWSATAPSTGGIGGIFSPQRVSQWLTIASAQEREQFQQLVASLSAVPAADTARPSSAAPSLRSTHAAPATPVRPVSPVGSPARPGMGTRTTASSYPPHTDSFGFSSAMPMRDAASAMRPMDVQSVPPLQHYPTAPAAAAGIGPFQPTNAHPTQFLMDSGPSVPQTGAHNTGIGFRHIGTDGARFQQFVEPSRQPESNTYWQVPTSEEHGIGGLSNSSMHIMPHEQLSNSYSVFQPSSGPFTPSAALKRRGGNGYC